MKGRAKTPKKEKIKERSWVEFFEMPPDMMGDLPRFTLMGTRFLKVEAHRGILSYGEYTIRLSTASGIIIIHGENMRVEDLEADAMVIKGQIHGLEYQGRVRR
ncbi:MAG: YabP/YqfC family sporulation protein [Christensenellales bacterium]|jgi:sporulation protein YqfC